jgi:hypothetical protein
MRVISTIASGARADPKGERDQKSLNGQQACTAPSRPLMLVEARPDVCLQSLQGAVNGTGLKPPNVLIDHRSTSEFRRF